MINFIDFYIPAWENCSQYDRQSGFFASALIRRVAAGLGLLLHNHGKMRSIMGCQFHPGDLEPIQTSSGRPGFTSKKRAIAFGLSYRTMATIAGSLFPGSLRG
ncbi:MAG: hypothetical protein ABWU13_07625 [Limnospira maxima]|uniref:hypothetical protein n=1 Tax=Limnospira indica TaxID=147322 RepID=UPI0001E2AA20|nr:hypothetical protein [Limnospira indica]